MLFHVRKRIAWPNPRVKQSSCRCNSTLQRATSTAAFPRPPLSKSTTYNCKEIEAKWYSWWEQNGFFKPAVNKKGVPFTMLFPPPNVTGNLHIGHALGISTQDAIARHRRMMGDAVSWIPGTDHAGIATQTVVEKRLWKNEKLTRQQLGRENFIEKVQEWKEERLLTIMTQMKKMGGSFDWDKMYFTMDKRRSNCVQETFIKLFEDDLIYRDARIVNWSCALGTALSDIENPHRKVDYESIDEPTVINLPNGNKVEVGFLEKFYYPISGSDSERLLIATTRLETMLADSAIAVHSKDPRFKKFHGKFVEHPITGKKLPIICDDILVDPEFGTGVVKVTPAHDLNDFASSKRHNLHFMELFNKDGTMNQNCAMNELIGLDRFVAREKVREVLKQKGLYEGRDVHPMRIARCSRSGDIIEPLVQPQWFVDCKKLAEIAKEFIKNNQIKINDPNAVNEWFRWLDNIQDWCISRQLWWGHPIPAYLVISPNEIINGMWIAAPSEKEANEKIKAYIMRNSLPQTCQFKLKQDEDVLDTWFSSGLLPISTQDSLNQKDSLTSLLETGSDILFFWVARMVMMCGYLTHRPPFKEVVLHPMVRDAQGKKMSKSLGNVIDPLEIIDGTSLAKLKDTLNNSLLPEKEIKRGIKNIEKQFPNGIPPCGSDALRFSLISYLQQSRQINLEVNRVVSSSHFNNKLWNTFKYATRQFEMHNYNPKIYIDCLPPTFPVAQMNTYDAFILSRLSRTVQQVQKGFKEYELHKGAQALYEFVMNDLSAFYLESIKYNLKKNIDDETSEHLYILGITLDTTLRLLHPFMPFLTEELWQQLRDYTSEKECSTSSNLNSIMISQFPNTSAFDRFLNPEIEEDIEVLKSVTKGLRSLRQTLSLPISLKLPFHITTSSIGLTTLLWENLDYIKILSNAEDISLGLQEENHFCTVVIHSDLKVHLCLDHIPLSQRENYRKKLATSLGKLEMDNEKLKRRINAPQYTLKVPTKIQEKERELMNINEEKIVQISKMLKLFHP